METGIGAHVVNSIWVVYILQWLKTTSPYRRFAVWLPMEEQKVHLAMSAIGAALTSWGMHGVATGSWVLGWQIAISIPPLTVLFHAFLDWATQMGLNQFIFAVAVKERTAAPVITTPLPEIAKGVTVTAPIHPVA